MKKIIFSAIFVFLPFNIYSSDFKIYDGTLYSFKPDLSVYGIQPVDLVYSRYFWDNDNKDNIPNSVKISRLQFDFSNSKFIVLDIEHWALRGEERVVTENLRKYIQLIDTIRSKLPGAVIGYYGLPVGRDYWRAIGPKESCSYKEWQRENERVSSLADHVDVSLPSLYTFYNDPGGWVVYAKANIEESRRIAPKKKVLVFLWPRFHDSNRFIGGKEISKKFWLLQLETAKQYADGIILWGGWGEDGAKGRSRWRDDSSWWSVTKQFIKDYKINE